MLEKFNFLEKPKLLGKVISIILILICLIKTLLLSFSTFKIISLSLENLSSNSGLVYLELENISRIVFSTSLIVYLIAYILLTILKSKELFKTDNNKDIVVYIISYIGQILFILGFSIGLGAIISYNISDNILYDYRDYFEIPTEQLNFHRNLFFILPISGLLGFIFCYFIVEIINILYKIKDILLDIKIKFSEDKTVT